MRKASFVVVALVIALAACSSSKKTGAPGTNTAGSTSSTPVAAGGGANSGYCALAKSYSSQSDEIGKAFRNIDPGNPDKAKQQLADAYKALGPKFKTAYDAALAAAPAEIKADVKLLGEGFLAFLAALERANYDITKFGQDPTIVKTFSDPKFRAAAAHVGKYGSEKCGIPYSPPALTSSAG